MKIIKKLIVISSLILFSQSAFASKGRLNSEGCHNDKKNNEYHCHEKDKDGNTIITNRKKL